MKYLDWVAVARGMAALSIVAYHATAIVQAPKYFDTSAFGGFFSTFGFAVDFFFVLSGFIILHVHRQDFGQQGRLRDYFLKRLVRIYPPYWVALILVSIVYLVMPGAGSGSELEPSRWLASALLSPHAEVPTLNVAWTLRHEVVFYAIFGLMIWWWKPGITLFLLWQTAIVVAWLTGGVEGALWGQLLNVCNLNFGFGMAVALLAGKLKRRAVQAGVVFGLAGLVAMVVGMYGGWVTLPYSSYLLACGFFSAFVLLWLVDREGWVPAPVQPSRGLVYLGDISYSVYLVHYVLLSMLGKIGVVLGLHRHLPGEVIFLLLVLLATAGGAIFHQVVEKPLLKWCRSRFVGKAARS